MHYKPFGYHEHTDFNAGTSRVATHLNSCFWQRQPRLGSCCLAACSLCSYGAMARGWGLEHWVYDLWGVWNPTRYLDGLTFTILGYNLSKFGPSHFPQKDTHVTYVTTSTMHCKPTWNLSTTLAIDPMHKYVLVRPLGDICANYCRQVPILSTVTYNDEPPNWWKL